MKKVNIRNRGLIKSIFRDYYSNTEAYHKFVSSHWKLYGKQFKVNIDDNGNIIYLAGVGFGDMMTKNPLEMFLHYVCHLTYLINLPNRWDVLKLIMPSLKVCRSMGCFFSFDCFKQMYSLALIKKHIADDIKLKRSVFLIIGDGYGFLSSLIKTAFPNSTVILIDIGKTLLFQAYYCQRVHPNCIHQLIDEKSDLANIDFLYCPAEKLENIRWNYDVAINIVSMQEMNWPSIEKYFSFLRKKSNKGSLFYCCNREVKILPDGEKLEFFKYPWEKTDKFIIDEYCPWYRYFFSRTKVKNGLQILGARIPFVNYFDGLIYHRLVVFKK